MAIDRNKASEFLRRLNALELEFELRVDMDPEDGQQHLFVADAAGHGVTVGRAIEPGTWGLHGDEPTPPDAQVRRPPTLRDLKWAGKCP